MKSLVAWLKRPGKKGQSSVMNLVMASIFLILGGIIIAKLVGYVPTDLTTMGDTNKSTWKLITDIVSTFGMSSLVLLAMIVALVIGAFYLLQRHG